MPYEFWVNNDQDYGNDFAGDDLSPDTPNNSALADCEIDGINQFRDLEDFARLQMKVQGILEELKSGEIQAVLKFKEGSVEDNPAINLYYHLDTFGGMDYVEDIVSARNHAGHPAQRTRKEMKENPGMRTNIYGLKVLANLTKTEEFVFPISFWVGEKAWGDHQNTELAGVEATSDIRYPEITEGHPFRYMLFEGADVGKGELVVELRRGGEVHEISSCWLDLKDIKDMYEEFAVADIYGKTWQEVNNIPPTSGTGEMTAEQINYYGNLSGPIGFSYPELTGGDPDYEKDYILFVHGWRMKPHEKYSFAETSFKRLWHQGYRGRFGSFSGFMTNTRDG
jgi:hypothetical protein